MYYVQIILNIIKIFDMQWGLKEYSTDALELAASLRPVYAYIKSDDNPADTPSRKRWSVRKTIRKE